MDTQQQQQQQPSDAAASQEPVTPRKLPVGACVYYRLHPGDGGEYRPAIVIRPGEKPDTYDLHVIGVPERFAQVPGRSQGDDAGQFKISL